MRCALMVMVFVVAGPATLHAAAVTTDGYRASGWVSTGIFDVIGDHTEFVATIGSAKDGAPYTDPISVSAGGTVDGGTANGTAVAQVSVPTAGGAGPLAPGQQVVQYRVTGSTSSAVSGPDGVSAHAWTANPHVTFAVRFTLDTTLNYRIGGDMTSTLAGQNANGEVDIYGKFITLTDLGTSDDLFDLSSRDEDLTLNETGTLGPGSYQFSVNVDELLAAGSGQSAALDTAFDVALTFATIPEPATASLCLIGAGAMFLTRRRR